MENQTLIKNSIHIYPGGLNLIFGWSIYSLPYFFFLIMIDC